MTDKLQPPVESAVPTSGPADVSGITVAETMLVARVLHTGDDSGADRTPCGFDLLVPVRLHAAHTL